MIWWTATSTWLREAWAWVQTEPADCHCYWCGLPLPEHQANCVFSLETAKATAESVEP